MNIHVGNGTQTLNESLEKGFRSPRGLNTQTDMDRKSVTKHNRKEQAVDSNNQFLTLNKRKSYFSIYGDKTNQSA